MEAIRVLIAEDNALQRTWLMQQLEHRQNLQLCGAAENGVEALGMILQTHPHVLLLDMVMPRMDGYSLLEKLRQLSPEWKPRVIAMTSLGRDDFITRAIDLQVDDYLVKPVDPAVLVQRIHRIAGRTEEIPLQCESPEQSVTKLLMQLGVPPHLMGYRFLRTALTEILLHPEAMTGLSRTLYPRIAQQHTTSVNCVERAIRHAISQTWNRGGGATYRQLLGRSASTVGDRPTNSEFLAQVSEALRADLRSLHSMEIGL